MIGRPRATPRTRWRLVPAIASLASLSFLAVARSETRTVVDLVARNPGVLSLQADWGDSFASEFPAIVGDVNGDGFDDFAIRQRLDGHSPYTALVFGGAHLSGGVRRFPDVPQSRFIHGEPFVGFYPVVGQPFADAGDFDGDGFADFLITAYSFDDEDRENVGRALLIFGQRDIPAEVELESLPGPAMRSVLFVSREEGGALGTSAAAVGDLNGDGWGDFAIGAQARGSDDGEWNAGRVFVVFGGSKLPDVVNVAAIGFGIPGLVIHGARGRTSFGGDYVGWDRTVEAAGDVNGDGIDDLLLGARWATRGLEEAGLVYLVFGRRDLGGDLFLADGGFGVEILGVEALARLGFDVSGAGDVDGDGLDDVLIGQPSDATGNTPGIVHLIYGRRDWPPLLRIDDPSLRRLAIHAAGPPSSIGGYGRLGWWVDEAGDQNGDGFPDILMSAPPKAEGFESATGAVYLVFGGPSLPAQASELDIGTAALPGIKLRGRRSMTQLGNGGDAAGDLDGDGEPDFIAVSTFSDFTGQLPAEESTIDIFFGGRFLAEEPVLHAVEPGEGPRSGGLRVALRGAGFRGAERVFFGEREAREVEVVDAARIEAVIPPQEEDVARVSVRLARAGAEAVLEDAFLYTEGALFPDLTLDPAALREAGHRTAVIEGVGARVDAGELDGASAVVARSVDEEGRIVVWTFRGGTRWPEVIAREALSDHGFEVVAGEDQAMFGVWLSVGTDLSGDGHGDMALGGAIDLPVANIVSPAGKAYVIAAEAGAWPPRWEMSDALAAGRAVPFPHARCGASRVATFQTPGGVTLLAISHQSGACRGLGAVVELYAAPIDLAAGTPAPVVSIQGDPEPAPNGSAPGAPRMFGSALAGGGDLNGDGASDLLVGARGSQGRCYIVLGSDALLGFQGSINDLIERGLAVRLRLDLLGTDLGVAVYPAGDFNGDGLADAALSAPYGGRDRHGQSFVVLGSRDLGAVTDIDLAAEDPTSHVRIDGAYPGDYAGNVVGAGDFNGDGFDEVAIIGRNERFKREEITLVFGRPDPPPAIDLRTLGARGFRIRALEGHDFLTHVVAAGDYDGDGHDDLAVGDRLSSDPIVDRVVVIYGRSPAGTSFIRGEVNDDGNVDLADPVFLLQHLFAGGEQPSCMKAADANDDGGVDVADAVFLLNSLFAGGGALPAPHRVCGFDPTPDDLNCEASPACGL